MKIELSGLDGFGVALYVGTGCFHRRDSLSGKKYSVDQRIEIRNVEDNIKGRNVEELEKASKDLAICSYEKGTLWGKEVRLVSLAALADKINENDSILMYVCRWDWCMDVQ